MRRLSLAVIMFLVPALIHAEPDLNLQLKVNIPLRVQGYLTGSFEPDNLFSTLDFVFPRGNRLLAGGLIKLQAGRAKLNDLTSTPGATAALAGILIKVKSVYIQPFAGYSSDGFVLEGDVRGRLNKKLFFIKRWDLELINKYAFDNKALWFRGRPSILIAKKKTTEFSIGAEYIWSGWNNGEYYVTRGGALAGITLFQRTRILIGGGKAVDESQGGYFFLEIGSRLF